MVRQKKGSEMRLMVFNALGQRGCAPSQSPLRVSRPSGDFWYPRVEFDIKFFYFSYLTPRGSSYLYSRSGSLLKLLGCFQQLPLQGLHIFIPVVGAC